MLKQLLMLMVNKTAAAPVYATWNPSDKDTQITLSSGNLDATNVTGFTTAGVRSTISKSSGKWYWEVKVNSGAPLFSRPGIAIASMSLTTFAGDDAGAASAGYRVDNGVMKLNNVQIGATGSVVNTGDVLGFALDCGGLTLKFYINNTLQDTYSLSTLAGGAIYAMVSTTLGDAEWLANFGATAFAFTPPTGYNSGLYT